MSRKLSRAPRAEAAKARANNIAAQPGRTVPDGAMRFCIPATSVSGLPPGFGEPERGSPPRRPSPLGPGAASPRTVSRDEAIAALAGTPLAEIERELIEATIQLCGGSIPNAARMLGVSASTLYRKRAAWSIRRRGG